MSRSLRRALVFTAGLAFILLGVALVVLPGPLTIPPILLGLYIWSTEFAFAHRFLEPFKEKGDEAWAAAKARPVMSAIVSGGGLILAAAAIWATLRYDLMDKAKDAIGL